VFESWLKLSWLGRDTEHDPQLHALETSENLTIQQLVLQLEATVKIHSSEENEGGGKWSGR